MRRREFITLASSAAIAWPLAARGQQPLPIVGYINSGAPGPMAPLVSAFHEGLSQAGYVEGRNVTVEYRWSEGHSERLPELAADLARFRQRQRIVARPVGPFRKLARASRRHPLAVGAAIVAAALAICR